MPLPIIIIFERHWDKPPKQLLTKMLPKLAAEGYNTVCAEFPQDLTIKECIKRVDETIEADQLFISQANEWLAKYKVKINDELCNLSYMTLSDLLQTYVSSQHYQVMAERIKNAPADLLMKDVLNNATKLHMMISGIDIDSSRLDAIVHQELSPKKAKQIKDTLNERNSTLFNNLKSLQAKREGIVFLCGALHAPGLMSLFKNNKMEDQVIYAFPHSSKNFNDELDDIEFAKNQGMPSEFCHLIANERDNENLLNSLMSQIKEKNNKYIKEISEGTSHSHILNQLYQVNFKTALRSGHYVDAVLEFDEHMNADKIDDELQQQGIQTYYGLFKSNMCLIVPEVNTREVAEKIVNLGKKS